MNKDDLPDELILVINSFLDSEDSLRKTCKKYRKLPLINGWYLYNKKAIVDYPVVYYNNYSIVNYVNSVKCTIYKNTVSIEVEYIEPDEERVLYWFETIGKTTSKVKCVGFDEVSVEKSDIKTLIIKQ